jgi:hypothetical protein
MGGSFDSSPNPELIASMLQAHGPSLRLKKEVSRTSEAIGLQTRKKIRHFFGTIHDRQ